MFFGKKWFNYALLAMIIVTLIDLIKKYILDKKMVNTDELIIYSAMFVGIFGFLHFLSNQNCRSFGKINKNLFFILFFCGILGYLFNICFTKSIFLAPDVSLTSIIISLNIVFVYLFSSMFFKTSPEFNYDVLFGIILIIIGINIISRKF
tara:strand:- start:3329 stop:3778 length:450 start_codon:yes stop_codon:yes gene_type:complete